MTFRAAFRTNAPKRDAFRNGVDATHDMSGTKNRLGKKTG